MKFSRFLLIAFITFLVSCKDTLTGKVVKVTDGDTVIIITDDNTQVKIRLHGVDCPERKQDFGNKARQFTSLSAFGKTVKVEVKDKDRYGRLVAIVKLPDGRILNEELLKNGLAWHYKHYDQSEKYTVLEHQAKRDKLGVWSMPNPIAPWEFRRVGR